MLSHYHYLKVIEAKHNLLANYVGVILRVHNTNKFPPDNKFKIIVLDKDKNKEQVTQAKATSSILQPLSQLSSANIVIVSFTDNVTMFYYCDMCYHVLILVSIKLVVISIMFLMFYILICFEPIGHHCGDSFPLGSSLG